MKAWVAEAHGGLDVLALRELPVPEPGPGQVRLRVGACGLNFADLLTIKGTYQTKPPLPLIPGGEVCGFVEAVGEGVRWDVGTRLAGYCGTGGMAERVVLDAAACIEAPTGLSDEVCAAIPVAYGSAELALSHRARLREGEWLAVSGAGGGVGLTGVEIGALLGARVIALARGEAKAEAARRAGARTVLSPEDFDLSGTALKGEMMRLTGGHGLDVIYDPVGDPLARALARAAAFEARILPIGFAGGEVPNYRANHLLVKNVDVVGFWWGAYFQRAPTVMAESLKRLFSWAKSERIAPHVSDALPLGQGVEALALIRDRKAVGKVVVTVAQAA